MEVRGWRMKGEGKIMNIVSDKFGLTTGYTQ